MLWGNKNETAGGRKGWGRGEVALMLCFIPKPTLLGSLYTSTPNTRAHTRKHTHTLKNKFSIRQGFVEKAINQKARGCWEQTRQRDTNKNTLEACTHARTNVRTRTHTHTQFSNPLY